MEQKQHCVEILNKICKRLNNKYIYNICPTYGAEEYTTICIKEKIGSDMSEGVKAKVIIKKNGCVLFRINLREKLHGINFEQRILASTAADKNWLNIDCGYNNDIDGLLGALKKREEEIIRKMQDE